jgi:hypothetical protein
MKLGVSNFLVTDTENFNANFGLRENAFFLTFTENSTKSKHAVLIFPAHN